MIIFPYICIIPLMLVMFRLFVQGIQETIVTSLLLKTQSNSESGSSHGHEIPATTYMTPSALVARRLLAYSRDVHLIPSIKTFTKQVRCFHE